MNDMRLNSYVTRGEIDNTQRGTVVARLWLHGQDEPLEFSLAGDCLRDLAGSHFLFANTPLEPFQTLDADLSEVAEGVVGEITASARLCMHKPNESGQYEKPVFVNVLRLEFFTALGRVVLECFDCRVQLVSTSWSMSADEEYGQVASNFAAWQSHISRANKSEFAKDVQRLSFLYDEIHQRFADSLDFDQYEASLMGWNGILGALADEREENTKFPEFEDVIISSEPFIETGSGIESHPPLETGEWDTSPSTHPVLESIKDLIEDFEMQAANFTFPRGRHYQALIQTLSAVEKGLSELINPVIGSEKPADMGMMGCREYLGQMMVAFGQLSQLMAVAETTEGRRELLFLRDGMLDLREGISVLRFELHNL